MSSSPRFPLRARVEGRFGGGKTWYAGAVAKVYPINSSEHEYDIQYDDGDFEAMVSESLIRVESNTDNFTAPSEDITTTQDLQVHELDEESNSYTADGSEVRTPNDMDQYAETSNAGTTTDIKSNQQNEEETNASLGDGCENLNVNVSSVNDNASRGDDDKNDVNSEYDTKSNRSVTDNKSELSSPKSGAKPANLDLDSSFDMSWQQDEFSFMSDTPITPGNASLTSSTEDGLLLRLPGKNDAVEVLCHGEEPWISATVLRVRPNGSFDIDLGEGTIERAVARRHVRFPLNQQNTGNSSSTTQSTSTTTTAPTPVIPIPATPSPTSATNKISIAASTTQAELPSPKEGTVTEDTNNSSADVSKSTAVGIQKKNSSEGCAPVIAATAGNIIHYIDECDAIEKDETEQVVNSGSATFTQSDNDTFEAQAIDNTDVSTAPPATSLLEDSKLDTKKKIHIDAKNTDTATAEGTARDQLDLATENINGNDNNNNNNNNNHNNNNKSKNDNKKDKDKDKDSNKTEDTINKHKIINTDSNRTPTRSTRISNRKDSSQFDAYSKALATTNEETDDQESASEAGSAEPEQSITYPMLEQSSKVHPRDVVATRKALMRLIDWPVLTDKLLFRPPFRFLHDVVMQIINCTGFAVGLFNENEIDARVVRERGEKVTWLEKIIAMVELSTNRPLPRVKPRKIAAGKEASYTLFFLRMLAHAALRHGSIPVLGSNKWNLSTASSPTQTQTPTLPIDPLATSSKDPESSSLSQPKHSEIPVLQASIIDSLRPAPQPKPFEQLPSTSTQSQQQQQQQEEEQQQQLAQSQPSNSNCAHSLPVNSKRQARPLHHVVASQLSQEAVQRVLRGERQRKYKETIFGNSNRPARQGRRRTAQPMSRPATSSLTAKTTHVQPTLPLSPLQRAQNEHSHVSLRTRAAKVRVGLLAIHLDTANAFNQQAIVFEHLNRPMQTTMSSPTTGLSNVLPEAMLLSYHIRAEAAMMHQRFISAQSESEQANEEGLREDELREQQARRHSAQTLRNGKVQYDRDVADELLSHVHHLHLFPLQPNSQVLSNSATITTTASSQTNAGPGTAPPARLPDTRFPVSLPQEIFSNEYMPTLTSLSCTGFNLPIFPDHKACLPALHRLTLSDNCITKLTPRIDLVVPSVNEFVLDRNCLTVLPSGFVGLTPLRRLDLAHNWISEIPACLFNLPLLERVDISHNRITHLPQWFSAAFFSCPAASTWVVLKLNGNPLGPKEHRVVENANGDTRVLASLHREMVSCLTSTYVAALPSHGASRVHAWVKGGGEEQQQQQQLRQQHRYTEAAEESDDEEELEEGQEEEAEAGNMFFKPKYEQQDVGFDLNVQKYENWVREQTREQEQQEQQQSNNDKNIYLQSNNGNMSDDSSNSSSEDDTAASDLPTGPISQQQTEGDHVQILTVRQEQRYPATKAQTNTSPSAQFRRDFNTSMTTLRQGNSNDIHSSRSPSHKYENAAKTELYRMNDNDDDGASTIAARPPRRDIVALARASRKAGGRLDLRGIRGNLFLPQECELFSDVEEVTVHVNQVFVKSRGRNVSPLTATMHFILSLKRLVILRIQTNKVLMPTHVSPSFRPPYLGADRIDASYDPPVFLPDFHRVIGIGFHIVNCTLEKRGMQCKFVLLARTQSS